eukprot:TRINITY_DN994_c1_g1_i1.p1 TRINITY_DN994_c1_g1~~TRINITY_DN994_c1_g1_i1.p1  ORF type:complete len:634 (-),score=226.79 TRINITY_DN994_c1_g1_i1:337-2178(-)
MATLVSYETLNRYLPQILEQLPEDWRGTTFNNKNLLSRAGFAKNLHTLLSQKEATGGAISTPDLTAVGNAEDYLRVSSNISTTLEVALGLARGYDVSQVFTFSSRAMPFVAVGLTSSAPVHVYVGDAECPFTDEQTEKLKLIGCELVQHKGPPQAHADGVVLALESAVGEDKSAVDGIVAPNVLYIARPERIDESKILVIRKRMNTPVTTPMAETLLKELAGVSAEPHAMPADAELAAFYAHLQQLSGTAVHTAVNPVVCTAGLSTLCSLWVTLAGQGGADVLMCSTAYGGSSQLVDVLTSTTHLLKKHTFDIQGTTPIVDSIRGALEKLAANPDVLFPTTVLFVEMPTNPDMKLPDPTLLAEMLKAFMARTGRQLVLLIDATFAPDSRSLTTFGELVPDLAAIVFLSLSKSVSRGHTTGGTLIANHTERARSLVRDVTATAQMLGTGATPDQMAALVRNHDGVEGRCQRAYAVAATVGAALQAAVKAQRGEEMRLAFVTPEQAALGYTTSTFSFNLPPPRDASADECAGLAQRFVDLICAHAEFKPCVSFGQDNGLVYATVPATSTQGAIKEEDKAKQAVGGVQLVRLSFAPGCDAARLTEIVNEAVKNIYE